MAALASGGQAGRNDDGEERRQAQEQDDAETRSGENRRFVEEAASLSSGSGQTNDRLTRECRRWLAEHFTGHDLPEEVNSKNTLRMYLRKLLNEPYEA